MTKIEFDVENSIPQNSRNKKRKEGGIGLQNVQKRLDIIYDGKYQLDINREKTKFKVRLVIKK